MHVSDGGGGAIDTADVVVTIDRSHGSERLEQRVVRYAPGRSRPVTLDGKHELLYVVSGRGALYVGGDEHRLEPEMGAYVVSGETYEVDNPGPAELVIVAVAAPQDSGTAVDRERRTVRYSDQPALEAGDDREFRYLVNQDLGCLDVTQFVGLIPPGRAPTHSHSYDEIVYILDGDGILHLGGQETPIGPGSAMHLPPLVEHCLENTGMGSMRVLGTFHPSGDPASSSRESPTGSSHSTTVSRSRRGLSSRSPRTTASSRPTWASGGRHDTPQAP